MKFAKRLLIVVTLLVCSACSSAPPTEANSDSGKLNSNDDRGSFIGTEGSNRFTQYFWWL